MTEDVDAFLARLDEFVAAEIDPLQAADDNERFFDHRREWARTDFERDGLPARSGRSCSREARRRADAAGLYRFSLPSELGGQHGSNARDGRRSASTWPPGLGLHNDLQTEHSVVGNLVFVHLLHAVRDARAARGARRGRDHREARRSRSG